MLKKFLLGLTGLFVVYVLVVWSGVLPRNTAAQDQALTLLKQPYQYAHGKQNGFRDLWLVPYDIPLSERVTAYEAEKKYYLNMVKSGKSVNFLSELEKKYPKQELPSKRLCPPGPESCLSYVRANLDDARKTASEFSAMRVRAEALRNADHIGNDLDFNFLSATLMPSISGFGRLQTLSSALDFVDGKSDLALDSACQNLATSRRLRSHTDLIMVDMVVSSYARDNAALLTEMLAELPADHVLPASCGTALAPIGVNELDQCDLARGELKSMFGFIDYARKNSEAVSVMMGADLSKLIKLKLINVRASEARIAPLIASLCSGQPTPDDLGMASLGDKIFDPSGAYFTDLILAVNYTDYQRRTEDFAGLLQTVRTIVWLRDKPEIESALAQLPDDLKTGSDKRVFDQAGQSLNIKVQTSYGSNSSKIWALPLAASRLPAKSTASDAAPAATKTADSR